MLCAYAFILLGHLACLIMASSAKCEVILEWKEYADIGSLTSFAVVVNLLLQMFFST